MRVNILTAALNPQTRPLLDDPYVLAWDKSVYPLSHGQSRNPHEPFADLFSVTQLQMEELAQYLENQYRSKQVPTFYLLEQHYAGRLDRMKLAFSCQYFRLAGSWDAAFWAQLKTNHPGEAARVWEQYDRDKELSLM